MALSSLSSVHVNISERRGLELDGKGYVSPSLTAGYRRRPARLPGEPSYVSRPGDHDRRPARLPGAPSHVARLPGLQRRDYRGKPIDASHFAAARDDLGSSSTMTGDRTQAQELYKVGRGLYGQQRYEEALSAFDRVSIS